MPRFAANVSMLFDDVPFLDRFARAAQAGFEAVECQFPYGHDAAAIRDRLDANSLTMVLHNLPPGDQEAGDRGIACLPDRVPEFKRSVQQGIETARRLGVRQLNCLAGGVERHITLEPIKVSVGAQQSLRGSVPLPAAFTPKRTTISVFDRPGGKQLGMRVIYVN